MNSYSSSIQRSADMLQKRADYFTADKSIDRVFSEDIAKGKAKYQQGVKSRGQQGAVTDDYLAQLEENIVWADEDKIRRDKAYRESRVGRTENIIDLSVDIAGQVIDTGEVTFAYGGTGGVSAGGSFDVAVGAEIGIPAPEAGLGVEFDAGPVQIELGEVRPQVAHFSGVQLTLGFSASPKMLYQPFGASARYHGGDGFSFNVKEGSL